MEYRINRNGEQDENEMESRTKMKWNTGRKLNGIQDENEMEYRMKMKWNTGRK